MRPDATLTHPGRDPDAITRSEQPLFQVGRDNPMPSTHAPPGTQSRRRGPASFVCCLHAAAYVPRLPELPLRARQSPSPAHRVPSGRQRGSRPFRGEMVAAATHQSLALGEQRRSRRPRCWRRRACLAATATHGSTIEEREAAEVWLRQAERGWTVSGAGSAGNDGENALPPSSRSRAACRVAAKTPGKQPAAKPAACVAVLRRASPPALEQVEALTREQQRRARRLDWHGHTRRGGTRGSLFWRPGISLDRH